MQYFKTRDILIDRKFLPLADVRSPGEFDEGHITGARNIPLFNDQERETIGIIYKKNGKHPAIEKGLEIAGPKMSALAKAAKVIAKDNQIGVYCWRGGMRSAKMAWLFEMVGLQVVVLEGGYKAFRNQLLSDFDKANNFLILQGATGSGKTAILHELRRMGEQILDLEGLANHRGSAFGHMGMDPQPTSAQFQNDLYRDFLKLDHNRRIWIESESATIGRVYLPDTLWSSMNRSQVFDLKIDKKIRAKRLVEEYGQFDIVELSAAINKITNRFGGNRVKEALAMLESNRLYETAILLLDYYDKSYQHSKEKYKNPGLIFEIESATGSPIRNAELLINQADQLQL
jgi:tRNA 2-selenouridine synthase